VCFPHPLQVLSEPKAIRILKKILYRKTFSTNAQCKTFPVPTWFLRFWNATEIETGVHGNSACIFSRFWDFVHGKHGFDEG
jgi:hypothetical protein